MQADVIALVSAHKWVALCALLIGFIVRLLKSDTTLPVTVPAKWRPWIAMGLGLVGGILEHVANGTAWGEAVTAGLLAGALPILGHQLGIESLRDGKELPVLVKPDGAK